MAGAANGSEAGSVAAVDVRSFDFQLGGAAILKDLNFIVQPGTRTLLIGHNGAGKTTLLRVLAGKHLTRRPIQIFGKDAFSSSPQELGITYLGTEWASNPVVRSDILVKDFLDSVGGNRFRQRRDVLLNILDVDLEWHMHQISDGERRRVQLVMGLMVPWRLLLLDEVTVDLDVLVRADLLAFLVRETKIRKATIIYATHIFDGLHHFPTHLVHLSLGSPTTPSPIDRPFPFLFRVADRGKDNKFSERDGSSPHALSEMGRLGAPNPDFAKGLYDEGTDQADSIDNDRVGSQLLEMCLCWLREDRSKRRELEEKGSLPRRGAPVPKEEKNKERFYTNYNYWS